MRTGTETIVKSKAICPKCKSNDLFLIETWIGHFISWEQIGGKFDRSDGAMEPGAPFKVYGRCKKCKRRWTVRGALQIDDIIST